MPKKVIDTELDEKIKELENTTEPKKIEDQSKKDTNEEDKN